MDIIDSGSWLDKTTHKAGADAKSIMVYITGCFGSLIGTGAVGLFECENRVRNFTVLYSMLLVIGMSEFVIFGNNEP